MAVLTKGRTEIACRDNIGGIRYVYLFKFVDYAFNEIVGVRSNNITSFPYTDVYRFDISNGSFNETINNDENGISYNQTLTFTLLKQDLFTTQELKVLTNIDFRYIVEYNDGSLKMGGVYNGANITNLELVSGGSKQELNGYNLTRESNERYKAPYMEDTSVVTHDVSYFFQNGLNFVFQDIDNYLFE